MSKKVWKFIWEDDSVWSWIVNIVLAFVFIKFIVYPGLGFFLGTTHPVVAVMSESMEHKESFGQWWQEGGKWYGEHDITQGQFQTFRMRNGFLKGDIIVLTGPKGIQVGDIIVFQSGKPEPIIHRVVKIWQEGGKTFYGTKGDNWRTNKVPIQNALIDETKITEQQVIGKAVLKIPFLGYVKILAVDILILLKSAFA